MKAMIDKLDPFETLLLAIIGDAPRYRREAYEESFGRCSTRGVLEEGINRPIKKADEYFTFSLKEETDEDHRLFTTDLELLLEIPDSSYGIVLLDGDSVQEGVYTKLKREPKGYLTRHSYDSIWQHDFTRHAIPSLKYYNTQKIFGIKDRRLNMIHPVGMHGGLKKQVDQDARHVSYSFAVSASLVEDAMLSQFWQIAIKDSRTIKTYADEECIKELLDLRDSPLTEAGKRKKILHWVSRHKRRTKNKTTEVQRHLRGIENMNIGGFNISITNPTKGG